MLNIFSTFLPYNHSYLSWVCMKNKSKQYGKINSIISSNARKMNPSYISWHMRYEM